MSISEKSLGENSGDTKFQIEKSVVANSTESKDNVLLDLTTAITFVSDCCTKREILKEYGEKWKLIGGNVYDQLIDENKNPVYPKLLNLLENKNIMMVESAYEKFITMIEKMGSDTEIESLKQLQKKIKIIKAEPAIFFTNLGNDTKLLSRRKWSQENIDTFGTAETHGWTVYTGNLSIALFIQERQDNLKLKCQPHRSRSFVGKRKYLKMNTL